MNVDSGYSELEEFYENLESHTNIYDFIYKLNTYADDYKNYDIQRILLINVNKFSLEFINNYDMGNLKLIDMVMKYLEYNNFNFNLLDKEYLIYILDDVDLIRYFIDNNLYDFNKLNPLFVLTSCNTENDEGVFKFWIDYFNIDVHADYNKHTLHYTMLNKYQNLCISDDSLTKSLILIKDYNLYPNAYDYLQDSIYNNENKDDDVNWNISLIELLTYDNDYLDKIQNIDESNNDLVYINMLLKLYHKVIWHSNDKLEVLLYRILNKINVLEKDILKHIKLFFYANKFYDNKLSIKLYKSIIQKLNIDILEYVNYIDTLDDLDKYILFLLYYIYINSDIQNYVDSEYKIKFIVYCKKLLKINIKGFEEFE